ncbi:hypothetical protein [Endomicrobium proavitum]|uniref:Putative membrane protein n=1 Tax=Endomicrobium proavitum TaxID=1408281 RepID=A0A0G3WL44_9BACT|nr:hypothetical protein [Endomicrobium proavitum]AKL98605.1 putative membrane protein [Endomicrobium proavitum]
MIWFFRICLILAGPIIAYLKFNPTLETAAAGLGAALVLVFAEYFLERIFCKKTKTNFAILDASALSDARIYYAAKTRFLSFNYIIAGFVISQLKTLEASRDLAVKNSARRGLNTAEKFQKDEFIKTKTFAKSYKNLENSDAKLIEAAKNLNALIITADFSLTRAAAAAQVAVLNINDLASSLSKIYLPGENLTIYLAKEGSQHNQAAGYLNDGTLVVAEDGKKFIGKRVTLKVTSVVQTSSGKMIFGKVETEILQNKHSHHKFQGHTEHR